MIRKDRCDTRKMKVAEDFSHSCCDFANNGRSVSVLNTDLRYDIHHQRIQTERTKVLYQKFLESQLYYDYIALNSGMTIGETLFKQAMCTCIKWCKLRKCADTLEVQFKLYLNAFRGLRKSLIDERCSNDDCLKCTNDDYLNNAFTSKSNFLSYLLCDAITHENLSRSSPSWLLTSEKIEEINNSVTIHDTNKLKIRMGYENIKELSEVKRRKLTNEKHTPIKSIVDLFRQDEKLTLANKSCCNNNCEDCGVAMRLSQKR